MIFVLPRTPVVRSLINAAESRVWARWLVRPRVAGPPEMAVSAAQLLPGNFHRRRIGLGAVENAQVGTRLLGHTISVLVPLGRELGSFPLNVGVRVDQCVAFDIEETTEVPHSLLLNIPPVGDFAQDGVTSAEWTPPRDVQAHSLDVDGCLFVVGIGFVDPSGVCDPRDHQTRCREKDDYVFPSAHNDLPIQELAACHIGRG